MCMHTFRLFWPGYVPLRTPPSAWSAIMYLCTLTHAASSSWSHFRTVRVNGGDTGLWHQPCGIAGREKEFLYSALWHQPRLGDSRQVVLLSTSKGEVSFGMLVLVLRESFLHIF